MLVTKQKKATKRRKITTGINSPSRPWESGINWYIACSLQKKKNKKKLANQQNFYTSILWQFSTKKQVDTFSNFFFLSMLSESLGDYIYNCEYDYGYTYECPLLTAVLGKSIIDISVIYKLFREEKCRYLIEEKFERAFDSSYCIWEKKKLVVEIYSRVKVVPGDDFNVSENIKNRKRKRGREGRSLAFEIKLYNYLIDFTTKLKREKK